MALFSILNQNHGKIWIMSEILIASLVFALAICGLAAGFILNNKPLQGSCGGLSTFEEGAPCEFCGKEQGDCIKTDS